MINRAASALILALAAAAAARADDNPAPLADTKRQLLLLQKDEAAAKTGTGDSSLKAALPGLQTTLQGREVLPTTVLDPSQSARIRQQKRKEMAEKNWLVDGYNQLDPNAPKAGKDDPKEVLAIADDEAANPGDGQQEQSEPRADDNLIKIFATQTKSSATPANDQKSGGPAAREPLADPLAPFLQSWLANSPVRDAALAAVPKDDASAAGVNNPAPEPVILDAPAAPLDLRISSLTGDGSSNAPENPYLLNVALPPPDSSPNAAPTQITATIDALLNESPAQPSQNGQPDKLISPAREDQFKPPATPADEDKKYFPQLKRF